MKNKEVNILAIAIGIFGVVAAVVAVLVGTHIICLSHEWNNATCVEPQTCSLCGATQGEVLGHMWEEATCSSAKHCWVCGITEGVPLTHTWEEATCSSAKHCTVCSVTDGAALPHNWLEASCEDPQICSVCGEQGDAALGHNWTSGTCTVPPTCTVCFRTEGTASGHVFGEKQRQDDVVQGFYTIGEVCTVCGSEVNTERINYTSFISGGKYIFTPAEFMTRMNNAFDWIGSSLNATVMPALGDAACVVLDENAELLFVFHFIDGDGDNLLAEEAGASLFMAIAGTENAALIKEVIEATIIACDPSIGSHSAALQITSEVVSSGVAIESYIHNETEYMVANVEGAFTIIGAVVG